MPRIAIARLWYEANSFAPGLTGEEPFRSREWARGAAALEAYRGTATELGALAEFLAARPGWQAVVLRCASAQPGPPLRADLFAAWRDEVLEGLRQGGPWDGVYLSLHGACLVEGEAQPELAFLRALRGLLGPDLPVVASFDPHANLLPEVAGLLDGASIYRTYPHIDMDAAARRALAQLERRIGGAPRAHGVMAKRPMVLHSFHMRHEAGPMAEIWELARREEAAAEILDASPIGGFAWGDTPGAGPGALVYATSRAAAAAAADRLADAIAARRARFDLALPGPQDALAQALAAPPGTVALLDPADNPLSGGLCDTPGLLRALLAAKLEVPAVFAFLHDAALVARAAAAGQGAVLECDLGGRVTPDFGPPVAARAVVERLTEGRFTNTGPMERGAPVDLGPTALLRVGALGIIIASRKEAAIDPAFFALHGIDPSAQRLLAVKGKNHFRAAFAPLCVALVECDAPGPAALDLRGLPFRQVPRDWLPPAP
ncbi:M81 family metallopeptidase [Pseudoroseomonas cervicalis]|uniref:M81 family metallopeptidase n=1 Tax=Teichococcus cervicalis TaxID=204525 RepID=UPI00278673B5|nr:M81 family metallopeptidase [Pseudoroseomonas cervicalis]MDQ1080290.1 microcystin degradation protein MlrC [Pseudoroseomonas cervicalis]